MGNNMTTEKDPLDKLIVDENQSIDSDLLASLIEDFMQFTKDGEFIFTEKFFKESDWKKVLFFLLGRKVIFIKSLKDGFKEEIQPKDISDLLVIPPKSITRILSTELKGITKSTKGSHKIPNYNLHKCKEVLENKHK